MLMHWKSLRIDFAFERLAHHFGRQCFDRIHVEIRNERDFRRVALRHEQGLEPLRARERSHRQDAVRVTHNAVERHFADDERARQIGLELFGCPQQTDGDGEVVRGAFFAEIGRREVDGDALEEKPEFLTAARTRSRDSWMAASGKPTIVKPI